MKKLTGLLAILLVCGITSAFAQPNWTRVNYPSSTIFTGIVTVNGEPVEAGAGYVGVFVNGECRMKAEVRVLDTLSYVSAVVHCSDSLRAPEVAQLKYWDASTGEVYDVDTTFTTAVHGDIRMFPINILKSGGQQTSTPEISLSDDFIKAFPMPFDTKLTVKATKEMEELTLIDNTGKTVLVEKKIAASEIVLETSELAEGMYVVAIVYADGTKDTKSVIKD